MFEVRCIVGDKKLSDVLRALKGHTLEHPVVIPVDDKVMSASQLDAADAQPNPKRGPYKKSKVRKSPVQRGGYHLKGEGATRIARDLIERTGVTHITAREIKRATMVAGYSPNAYSHALKILVADKTLRPVKGAVGEYDVIKFTPTVVTASEAIQHG